VASLKGLKTLNLLLSVSLELIMYESPSQSYRNAGIFSIKEIAYSFEITQQ
jgi:hypothetical protein